MGFLMCTARVHDLIFQKSEIQHKLLKISKRLRDLQQYAAMVGNGKISIGDLLASPGSMMGRSMAYMGFAHQTAMQYMQANAQPMMMMYQQQMGGAVNPQQAQMMQNYVMRSLYIQGREMAAQQETQNLKAEEEQLQAEQENLNTLNQEIAQELKAAKEARDSDIRDMAPKYVAQS